MSETISKAIATLIAKVILLIARLVLMIWLSYEWYVAPDLSTIDNIILTMILVIGFEGDK